MTTDLVKKLPRVLFPEYHSSEVMMAAKHLQENNIAEAVFLDDGDEQLQAFEIFKQRDDRDDWLQRARAHLMQKRELQAGEVDTLINASSLNLSGALLNVRYADLVLSGVVTSSSDVLASGIRLLGLAENARTISSSFLMKLPGRLLTYADCAVIPDPTPQQLADIAVSSAAFHEAVCSEKAIVAMLSFSTMGSSRHALVEKVVKGIEIARLIQPELTIDGEMQFDTAIVADIGKRKFPGSRVAGHANVLVFPDLNAANIACKITQHLAGAQAVGPFLHGLSRPWIDMSRGSAAGDIIETLLIACKLLESD